MARRGARGEGSDYQRKDGRWVATIFVGHDPKTGKRVRKEFYGKAQNEVLRKRRQWERDQEAGLVDARTKQPRQAYTVTTWLDYWIDHVVTEECEPTTRESYRGLVDRHIKPMLGHIALRQLQIEHVEQWLKALKDAGVGAPTRQNALKRLRRAINVAVTRPQQTGLRMNVAELATMPSATSRKVQPPNREHARALLEVASEHPQGMMVFLALGLGLRLGEVLGVRWDDLDLEAKTVTLRRRVARVKGMGVVVRHGMKMHQGDEVKLPMPDFVVQALREAQQAVLPRGYVISTRPGEPMDPSRAEEEFRDIRAQAGVTGKTFHQLRHDFASLLLNDGVPLWVVSRMMRHKSPSVTNQYYAHLAPELQWDATERMSNILSGLSAERSENPRAVS